MNITTRKLTVALLLAGMLCLALPALAQSPRAEVPIKSFELDNGMRFLVVERPQLTTVAGGWVAHVGSANERPGITGMAHLFEHMMFKGTSTIGTTDAQRDQEVLIQQEAVQEEIRGIYRGQREKWRRGELEDPYDAENRTAEHIELQKKFDELVEEQRAVMVKDQFDQIYTEAGASFLNAFTNSDITVYVITVPANKAELWFWMESDRLLNPVFREFYSERDVVYEERRLRTESTPTGKFDELFNSMFWQSHPYSWPTVGWPSDLRVISKAQADDFFDTYYAPNNLTAVLVGNITVERAKQLAQRYFARIPRGELEPPDVVTLEMEQLAEKKMVGECDCPPQIQIRYHTVPFGHRDDYTLDVLSGVLDGRTGRLFKKMIDGQEIASSAGTGNLADKYAGSFSFRAEAKGDATPAQLETAWDEVIVDLQENPVPAEELKKVKTVYAADLFRRLENPFFLMMQLAMFDGLGDHEYLNGLSENIERVTAEDVQRAANQYFQKENRLVGYYLRKAGTQAEEVPEELKDLPAQMRTALKQQLKQIRETEDRAQLQQGLEQISAQIDQVPPNMKPAMQLMKRTIEGRLAELGEGEQQ